VRGGELVAKVELTPLVGASRTETLRLGRRRSSTVSREFDALPAGVYWGYVTYRWKRGRRTLASGTVRTTSTRVGRRRGRAYCIVPVGARRRDTEPPRVAIEPADGDWHRAPREVRFHASDDFSGVRTVHYSVDGGPARNGRAFTIADEGAHVVDYVAEDVAGNRSAPQRATVRVDAAAPSAPVLSSPPSVTGDTTPTIAWEASTDSGSGVQAYAVAVRDANGSIVSFEQVGPGTTSASVGNALANGVYQAQVYALDGARPEPWVAASEPRAFEVDSSAPHPLGTDPANGTILPAASADVSPRIEFDRPLQASSVRGGDSVRLVRVSPGADPAYAVSCTSSCTSVSVDPASTLEEGIYEVSWTSGLLAEDGTPVTAGSFRFSIPFFERDFDAGGCTGFTMQSPWGCGTGLFPGQQLRAAPSSRSTLNITDATAETPPQSLNFTGEVVQARVTRRFVQGDAACDDYGELELRSGAAVPDEERYVTSVGPGDTLLESGALSGSSLNVRLAALYTLEGSICGSAPAAFYVDFVRLARKP
jgi:methionine-rich copper-binding protein CopC